MVRGDLALAFVLAASWVILRGRCSRGIFWLDELHGFVQLLLSWDLHFLDATDSVYHGLSEAHVVEGLVLHPLRMMAHVLNAADYLGVALLGLVDLVELGIYSNHFWFATTSIIAGDVQRARLARFFRKVV